MKFNNRVKFFKKKIPTLPQVNKRQLFVIAVFVLSVGLFTTQYLFGKSGIVATFLLSFLADFFMFWALNNDLKEKFIPEVFILPFFYSLAFGLFYFLVPARILTRVAVTLLYGFGLYSLFLSENIFTVSAIRTIALLSSARTVSFVITILSYFFLANVVFSLHLNIFYLLPLLFLFTFPLIIHSVWTYSLEINIRESFLWAGVLSVALLEVGLALWFWPSRPTVLALFMTGFFYSVIGLSQAWFDKRLFRNVIFEYIWVALIVFFVLILFTSWTG